MSPFLSPSLSSLSLSLSLSQNPPPNKPISPTVTRKATDHHTHITHTHCCLKNPLPSKPISPKVYFNPLTYPAYLTATTPTVAFVSENLTDSVVDRRLGELALRTNKSVKSSSSTEDFLDLSQAFSDFSACSSDISGELQRLTSLPPPALEDNNGQSSEVHPEPCMGFLQRENFSTEIIESVSLEDLQPTVKIYIEWV